MQGCDAVTTITVSNFDDYNDGGKPGRYPKYPTKIGRTLFVWDGNVGDYVEWSRNAYAYDCETWGYIGRTGRAFGAYSIGDEVTPQTETRRFLVKPKATAASLMLDEDEEGWGNYAFDY